MIRCCDGGVHRPINRDLICEFIRLRLERLLIGKINQIVLNCIDLKATQSLARLRNARSFISKNVEVLSF